MEDILNIQNPIVFDESISHYDIFAHKPYNSSSFDNSDEIRISISQPDACLLPSKSALHLYGRLVKESNEVVVADSINLVNNAICHMFREIRYEINGIEIDRNKNVGMTTLMKNLISITPTEKHMNENANWIGVDEKVKLTDSAGYFNVIIPLCHILGFAEDYKKIIINNKHELILIRSNNDHNAVLKTGADDDDYKIQISKIAWHMPHVRLSDRYKIKLLDFIAKDQKIPISFRTWDLYEYPSLPSANKHIWTVKTSTQLEKPRYIVFALQTSRKNDSTKNASQFDHCKVRDLKVFLNSECYPYGNLHLDFTKNEFAVIYEMYSNFQTSYYNKRAKPILTREEFLKNAPIFVIDCSKQIETIKSGGVDLRVEVDSAENFPANTTAFCLVIHDRICEYTPISGIVRKL